MHIILGPGTTPGFDGFSVNSSPLSRRGFHLPDYWQVEMIYCALVFAFVLFLEMVVPLVQKPLHVWSHYILKRWLLTLFSPKGGFVGLLFTLYEAAHQPLPPSSFC